MASFPGSVDPCSAKNAGLSDETRAGHDQRADARYHKPSTAGFVQDHKLFPLFGRIVANPAVSAEKGES